MMSNRLLTISSLDLYQEQNQLLNNISLYVNKGEVVGLVGLSGSGKSLLSKSILRLLPPTLEMRKGTIQFEGHDMTNLSERTLSTIRGKRIGLIQQNPMTALNPTLTIGKQLTEGLKYHEKLSGKEAVDRSIELLRAMGICEPELRMNDLPCQLSGGMRQRVLIAITFSCKPRLIIADEPTTALDVTTQKHILQLLTMHCHNSGTSLLLITHDLAVVSGVCDRIYVMKEGEIVESGQTKQVFREPKHAYTKALLDLRRVRL